MIQIPNTLVELVQFRVGNIKNFDQKEINMALELSLKAFNLIPIITYFKWSDVEIIDLISDLLVTFAAYTLLRNAAFNTGWSNLNENYLAMALSNHTFDNWITMVTNLKSSESFKNDFVSED